MSPEEEWKQIISGNLPKKEVAQRLHELRSVYDSMDTSVTQKQNAVEQIKCSSNTMAQFFELRHAATAVYENFCLNRYDQMIECLKQCERYSMLLQALLEQENAVHKPDGTPSETT